MDKYIYFADPVHGFSAVNDALKPLVDSPEVQRLRRIRQLGTGHLVYPGGEHSRFAHAIGAMALMGDALNVLEDKGTPISLEERNAAMAAMLLHDIGHSPVSHALEFVFIHDATHEEIGQALMNRLAQRLGPPVTGAAEIFADAYPRRFFKHLISGQLDMDRLDYLRRDSHMSGVAEGRIGVERILQTMRVHPCKGEKDAVIVIDAKGIHAVENVLTARRHMYWQVYLHKAVLAADAVLVNAVGRARDLIKRGSSQQAEGISPTLRFFLEQDLTDENLEDEDVLRNFVKLDDTDIIYSLKQWCGSPDPILADLSSRFINRDLFRCRFLPKKPTPEQVNEWKEQVAQHLRKQNITDPKAVEYYYLNKDSQHSAYELEEGSILMLDKGGNIKELADSADTESIAALREYVEKPYVCYPKEVTLPL